MENEQAGTPTIGWIGVGLMGHGAAGCILGKGWSLSILGHRNRQPVEDLVARGAREAANAAELARLCDIVFLCVPSSSEVEALVFGPAGLLSGARPGLTIVDCTTADPASTLRVAAALAEKGVAFSDSPLGRSPKEAAAGRLNTFTAGPADVKARIRPVQEAFCDTIIDAGAAIGNGHRLKLVNNFVTCGTAALLSRALNPG